MIRNFVVAAVALCACSESGLHQLGGAGGGTEHSAGGPAGGGTAMGGGFAAGGGQEGDGGGCSFGVSQDDNPVLTPSTAPPALSGGTLAVMSDGSFVAADADRDVVWLVAGTTVRRVALTAGSEPGRVVEGPAGHAFVALRRGGGVADLDLTLGFVVSVAQTCSAPRGLAWSAPLNRLTVACAGGELVELSHSLGTLTVQSTRHVADDLRDVVAVADGYWLTTFRQARVLHLDGAGNVTPLTGDVAFVPIEQPQDHADAGGAIDDFPFDAGIDFPDAGPPPLPASASFNRSIAWRMVPTPTGALVVHQRAQASTVTLLGTACGSGFGGYGSSGNFQFGTVHTTLDFVADGGVSTLFGAGVEHDVVLAVDVAVSAGGQVAMVGAGNGLFDVFPLSNPSIGTREGFSPLSPTAVTFRGEDPVVFIREPAQLRVYSGGVATTVMLGGPSVASTGWDIFHRATQSSIACASCHPEGGDDAHVWSLPEGLRRTPSLRGGLTGTAPFHWSGNEISMGALLDDVLVSRMSGPKESAPRQQALLTWLDSQAVLPSPPSDAAQVARGEATFNARCASCHAGAQGTNNTTVDVGTDGDFQVPRLHELWYRAPFMHDGRAATLADRFGPAGGSAHGDTATLTAPERDDLMAYLRTR